MANKPSKALEARIHRIVSQAAAAISVAVHQELTAELKKILAGHAQGQPHVASTRAAKPTGNGKAPTKKRGKRSRRIGPNAVTLEKIVNAVRATPGLRSEQIQKQVSLPRDQVKAALSKLRETGKVKTAGTRRATTYSAT